MSQIMKTFLGLFLILMLTTAETGILSVFLTVMHAQDLHSSMICEIENSGFHPTVIRNCFGEAETADSSLTITLYGKEGQTLRLTDGGSVPGSTADVTQARVVLKVPIRVPLLRISENCTLSGYAR